MLTKGAIGNLVNRYKAVLKKCNLINTFGSLAVASMLVMGGAGVAEAEDFIKTNPTSTDGISFAGNLGAVSYENVDLSWTGTDADGFYVNPATHLTLGAASKTVKINLVSTKPALEKFVVTGLYPRGAKDGTGATITVEGDLLDVTVHGEHQAYAVYSATGDDSGTLSAPERGGLFINTKETTLNATAGDTAGGIVAMSGGYIEVNSKKLTVNAQNAIIARGKAGVLINKNEDSDAIIILNGDIKFNTDLSDAGHSGSLIRTATVDIKLTNAQSSLNGNIYADHSTNAGDSRLDPSESAVGEMKLSLANGASWNSTETSFVNSLNIAGGIVNMSQNTGDIHVDELKGSGGDVVMDVAKDNKLIVKNISSETAVTAKAASGNADTLTTDDAAAMAQRITDDTGAALEENVTAEVAEGIVNAGFTTDSEGNVISGGGASSVTKAVLEAASVNTVALDRILTNDVRKRLGDIRSDASKTGVWMRWDGGKLKGEGLTNNFNTIQIGGDTKVAKNCRLGVAGSFTHGDTDFARGNGELEGFSFAAYATWMGENGMFADIVARLGHFSTEVNVEGQSGDMDNRVASLSGEYGWRLPICDQFFIEPQVELAYTYVSSDDLELDTAKFSFDNVDSLTGRAGVVFGWNLPDDRGNVYARASVVQQFMGDAKVTGYSGVGATVHETDGEDTWLEYGIGANVKLTDKTYIWADVERTEGADIDEEWRGTVGVRFSF